MSEPPLRLAFLINSLAPYGAENFVLNHARRATRSLFEPIVCFLHGAETLAQRIRDAGVEVVRLSHARRPTPVAWARFARLLRRRKIDIVQTHVLYAGLVGRVVGRACRTAIVVSTEQSTRTNMEIPPIWRRLNEATFRLPDAHVFITKAVADSYQEKFPAVGAGPLNVITNGIEARTIAEDAKRVREEVRAELGLGPTDFAFGNTARLAEAKGQRFGIRAFARFKREYPRARLFIMGTGPLESDLRTLAMAEGVGDAVHFLGQRLDVHRVLGGLDAYIHPALAEPLGIAVLEAMAAGLPVVASNVDGIPEFVRHEQTGWLVPPADEEGLARAMAQVVREPEVSQAVARRGQQLVIDEHDISASVSKYEALYLRLAEERGLRRPA